MRGRSIVLILVILFLISTFLYPKTTITLYTSVPQSIISDVEKEFEKTHPDIDLVVYRSGTSKIVAKLAAEIEANRISADMVWVADPAYYVYLKEKGLLVKYSSKELDKIPKKFKDKDGYFFGVRAISMVIAYNTNLLSREEAPKSWKALLDEKFRGTIALGSPLYSGSNLVWTYAMIKKYGWDYIEKLSELDVDVLQGNKAVLQELTKGADKVAIVLDYMVRGAKKKGSPVDLVYPEDGNVIIISPIAIFKNCKDLESAEKFVDFIASKRGQELMAKFSMIPLRTDVKPPEGVELEKILNSAIELNLKELHEKSEEIKEEFADIFE